MPDVTLSEYFKLIAGPPDTGIGAKVWPVALKYINLRYAQMCTIVVNCNGPTNTNALTIEQATDRIGTGTKVITVACPIWHNALTTATDTLVRQTAAVGFTIPISVASLTVIQVDPATLDQANGFYFLCVKTAGNAAGVSLSVEFYIDTRYKQATPPAEWTTA